MILERRKEVAEQSLDLKLVTPLEPKLKQIIIPVLSQFVYGSFHRVRFEVESLSPQGRVDIRNEHKVLLNSRLVDLKLPWETLQIEDNSKVIKGLVAHCRVAMEGQSASVSE